MTYDDRMAAILIADHERWLARNREESNDDTSRASIAHGSMDRRYLRGIGLIPQNESNRDYPHAAPRTSYTNARLGEGTSPNVRVITSKGTSVLPASNFRRESKAPAKRYATVDRQNKLDARKRDTDLSRFGSQGDYD